MLYSNATEVVLVLMRSRDGREPLRMMESDRTVYRIDLTLCRGGPIIKGFFYTLH